jgi:hypothetical protein
VKFKVGDIITHKEAYGQREATGTIISTEESCYRIQYLDKYVGYTYYTTIEKNYTIYFEGELADLLYKEN